MVSSTNRPEDGTMSRPVLAVLCLFFSLAPARGQVVEAQKRATIAYLRSLQTEGGGFVAAQTPPGRKGPNPPTLRASSAVLRALRYNGGEPRDLKLCARFIEQCFDRASGGFADRPGGKPDVTSTAVGLMALVEVQVPLDRFREPAVKYLGEHARTFEEIRIAAAGLEAAGKRPPQARDWLEKIASLRNDDGTYGKGEDLARETGGAVVAVLRLGGEVPGRDQVLNALNAGQRNDGGFGKPGVKGSDLESTYRVLRAFYMLKARPADEKDLHDFIHSLRNSDAGYGVSFGQPSSASGTYFAAAIEHWLAEE
jgi:prenyltransferase beta subunit